MRRHRFLKAGFQCIGGEVRSARPLNKIPAIANFGKPLPYLQRTEGLGIQERTDIGDPVLSVFCDNSQKTNLLSFDFDNLHWKNIRMSIP